MTPKIKKIIAREGLIILCLITISSLGWIVVEIKWNFNIIGTHFELWRNWIVGFALIPYIIYLIIRFIIWAIKTVKMPSLNIDASLVKIDVAKNMEKIADGINIGYNKTTHQTILNNPTLKFYVNAGGYKIADIEIPKVEERAKEVLMATAEAMQEIPDNKFKSLYQDLIAKKDVLGVASGTSANVVIKNAGYIFNGNGKPNIEVKFIEPSQNSNVFDIETDLNAGTDTKK